MKMFIELGNQQVLRSETRWSSFHNHVACDARKKLCQLMEDERSPCLFLTFGGFVFSLHLLLDILPVEFHIGQCMPKLRLSQYISFRKKVKRRRVTVKIIYIKNKTKQKKTFHPSLSGSVKYFSTALIKVIKINSK